MMIKNSYRWFLGILITAFLLIFITIKMDCHELKNDITSLKMKKRIIEDNIKVLRSKEKKLLSRNRIEKIAMEKFGMHFPSPEPLEIVVR